jgi:hypothetical protein
METLNTKEAQLEQEEIAIRAYHLWEKAGRHHHHDLEYWLKAEAELGAALASGDKEILPSESAPTSRGAKAA